MVPSPKARLQNIVPGGICQREQRHQHQDNTPPSASHGRHRFQPRTVHIFRKLRQVRLALVKGARGRKTFNPVLIVDAQMLAITTHQAFAQDAAGQLVKEVGLQ